MTVVAWVGGITALLAGTVAILQPDIKRVLAYSTVSQLGYMFLAVGIGAYTAAVFMVLCHTFYKGCLFLGAGSVIHGNDDNQDMRMMGRFRKYMPYTALAMVVAWLAIAGVPAALGLLLQGRDHQPGLPARRLRPVGRRHRRGRLHRGLHDPADLPHLLRQRALRDACRSKDCPVDLGWLGRGRAAVRDRRHRRRRDADSDPSPTVAYGDPVPVPSGHPPHEAPGDHGPAGDGARGAGGDRRDPEPAVHQLSSGSTSGSSRRSAACPRCSPTRFVQGFGLEMLTFADRARAASSSPTRSTRRASSTPTATR